MDSGTRGCPLLSPPTTPCRPMRLKSNLHGSNFQLQHGHKWLVRGWTSGRQAAAAASGGAAAAALLRRPFGGAAVAKRPSTPWIIPQVFRVLILARELKSSHAAAENRANPAWVAFSFSPPPAPTTTHIVISAPQTPRSAPLTARVQPLPASLAARAPADPARPAPGGAGVIAQGASCSRGRSTQLAATRPAASARPEPAPHRHGRPAGAQCALRAGRGLLLSSPPARPRGASARRRRRWRSHVRLLPGCADAPHRHPQLIGTPMTELLDLTQCEDFFGHCPVHAAHPPRECQLNFFDLSTHSACCALCVAAQPLDTYIQVSSTCTARVVRTAWVRDGQVALPTAAGPTAPW